MNASFTDEGIRVHRDVNIGLAIAADGNLVVPVLRHADQLSIRGIALAAGELIDKARRGRLGADDLAAARSPSQHRRERLDPLGTDSGPRPSRNRHLRAVVKRASFVTTMRSPSAR